MTTEVKQRIEQIRQGIVPEGYRKTRVGILPENWSVHTIKDCLERIERPVNVMSDELYTQIGIRSHGKGLFYKEPVTGKELGNKSVFWIEPGCFILNIVFAWEQAIGKTTIAEKGMIGSHRFPMYKPINNAIDIDYLIAYLLTKRGTDLLEAASPGGAGRNRTLGQDRFLKSTIVLPPLVEQQKIAAILSAQDRVIELIQRKVEEIKKIKKFFLSKMFPKKGQIVPEIRFAGFTDAWEQRKVSKMFKVTRGYVLAATLTADAKSDEMPYPVYSSQTKDKGLLGFYKDYLYENAITWTTDGANAGTVNYRAGKFYCTNVCGVLLSDAITVNQMIAEALNNVAHKYVSYVGNPKLMNNVMADIEINIPAQQKERERLSQLFLALDNLITLYQRKMEEEKEKKKALMQLLLTGIVKV